MVTLLVCHLSENIGKMIGGSCLSPPFFFGFLLLFLSIKIVRSKYKIDVEYFT